jgi:hypothetical protein
MTIEDPFYEGVPMQPELTALIEHLKAELAIEYDIDEVLALYQECLRAEQALSQLTDIAANKVEWLSRRAS